MVLKSAREVGARVGVEGAECWRGYCAAAHGMCRDILHVASASSFPYLKQPQGRCLQSAEVEWEREGVRFAQSTICL